MNSIKEIIDRNSFPEKNIVYDIPEGGTVDVLLIRGVYAEGINIYVWVQHKNRPLKLLALSTTMKALDGLFSFSFMIDREPHGGSTNKLPMYVD